MTLEEAKKILEKEGFYVEKATRPCAISESFIEYEDPTICEAMQVVNSAGYFVCMEMSCFDERKARLKEEYGKNHIKGDFSGNKSIGYCGEPISGSPLSAVEGIKLKRKDNRNTSENPALKESASQFNDALLDEQAKKIDELTKEKTNLEDQITVLNACKEHNDKTDRKQIKHLTKKIARLNKIIHKKNLKIEEFRKESSRHLRGKIKMFGENLDLSQELGEKNEELRLSKIREKNLAKLGLKYVWKNEKLKKELADKVVDKIDARALKSAESALTYKEKVIAEKDEVIADLGKELKAQKDLVDDISLKYDGAKHNLKLRMDECEKLKEKLDEANNRIKAIRKYSKEYREYGIEAVKMIRKMAKVIVNEGPVSSEDFKEYRRLANGYSFNPQLPDFSEEEEKKLTAKMVDINAKCMRAARESINDVFESYAAKYAKSTLDELKDKAYESFNAKAHKLGLVGSKDGKGISDQMIRVDIAKEGADQSGKIVICGKDFCEILKESEEAAEELSKVLNDVIDQSLQFGEIIIKKKSSYGSKQ